MQLHDTNSGSSAGTLSAIKDPLTCLNHAGQSQFAISLSALTAQVLIYLRRRPPVPSLILTNGSSDAMTPNHALLGIAVLLYALHRLLYPAHADNNPSQRLSDLIVAGIACQVIDSLSDYGVLALWSAMVGICVVVAVALKDALLLGTKTAQSETDTANAIDDIATYASLGEQASSGRHPSEGLSDELPSDTTDAEKRIDDSVAAVADTSLGKNASSQAQTLKGLSNEPPSDTTACPDRTDAEIKTGDSTADASVVKQVSSRSQLRDESSNKMSDKPSSDIKVCPISMGTQALCTKASQTSCIPRVSVDAEFLDILGTRSVKSMGLAAVPSGKRFHRRAQPNQRLVTAFGVENCFTTSDQQVCATFQSIVEGRLNKKNEEWAALATRVEEVVRDEFTTTRKHLKLFAVVQMITLKCQMHVLFGYDTRKRDVDESMRELASEINQQWLRSKAIVEAGTTPEWKFERQDGLREALKKVLPNKDVDDRIDNPLNQLLPGYETMWRVVLRCFAELTARDHAPASEWCDILRDFTENPTDTQLLRISDNKARTSASQISKETLRLYPPTRRVYREYETKTGEMKIVAADIEACHHNPTTWAPDPLRSRPDRWNGMEQKDIEDPIFRPFGGKPFTCPVKRRVGSNMPFGLAMLALLVGTLVKQTAGGWEIIGELPGNDEPLDTEREAYSKLWLKQCSAGGEGGNGSLASRVPDVEESDDRLPSSSVDDGGEKVVV
ncbi:hypothetical protein LTS09_009967 [Friedmanniomyces endolithicus]|nr:hypothetical protein LTS09_009967 [Friedmanniomyces endolithicus]